MKYLTACLSMAVILFYAPVSFAAEALDAPTVEKFVSTLSDARAMGEKMRAEGRNDIISEQVKKSMMERMEFTPYSTAVETMKTATPSDYKVLSAITGKNGFSTPESWAGTGDKVILAYMAEKVSQSGQPSLAEMKQQITPEMMKMMPPEMVKQMQAGMKLMETVEKAPQADRNVVRPYIAQIEAAMPETKNIN